MTDYADIAKRAVACKRWRWMPGMLVMSDPDRVPRVIGSPVWPSELRARVTSVVLGRWYGVGQFCVDHPDAENESMSGDDLPGTLPDFNDAATLGCLLALVRETWGDPVLFVKGGMLFDSPTWTLIGHKKQQSTLRNIRLECLCDLEAEALVFALEAE